MKNGNILIIFMMTLALSSCSNFLDVSDELAEQRNFESIFNSPVDTRRWLNDVYLGIPDPSNMHASNGYSHAWPILSDEIDLNAQANDWNMEIITPSHFRANRWSGYWQRIRQANIFLEKVHTIPQSGDADFIDEAELVFLKAQARFLRAYYHYLLFELYGPIPIITEPADPDNTKIDYARNSVDEVVQFIYDELTAVSNDLRDPDLSNENQLAIPTKGAALALRAKLMVYAASPLYNGGYINALKVTNKDGKRLFPDFSVMKWQKALEACQSFIDYAESGNYDLFVEYDNQGNIDAGKSIYELHNSFNEEVIFARSNVDWGNVVSQSGLDGVSIPRGARGGTQSTGKIAVLQELVDDFFMMDGLKINESPLYSETGFTANASDDLTGNTETGTFRMYINREPRFYQTVFFNGRRWHIGNEQIWFNKGGNSDNRVPNHAKTGYISYKRLNRSVYNQGSNPRSLYRPGILMRLAEFYLLYAEALNEVNPSDSRVIEYVDKIRERAGIPLLADIKPGIKGNKEMQREAIRQEIRVELATEGQRYFDVRRWMIAGNEPGKGGQGGQFHGMNMEAETLEGFYTRTVIEVRKWTENMYFAPIPIEEMQNSSMLVQNPGYN